MRHLLTQNTIIVVYVSMHSTQKTKCAFSNCFESLSNIRVYGSDLSAATTEGDENATETSRRVWSGAERKRFIKNGVRVFGRTGRAATAFSR